ncbi:30S ribosomal protein S7 [Myxococcota bacterium]|nr:30S ribosomal protein S7 [Myxococcota bacterium]MBU1382634.1 30S ribosomal protein S7 [Myxococcota bacterium]MBU1495851.1 30S ribosomal protein S7 [Myxococcota bacterium]
MSRRGRAPERKVIPDPKFRTAHMEMRQQITKFINRIMLDGKKSTAERIVYGAFDIINQRLNEEPLLVFERALNNVKPKVEVKSRRVGGSTYQVPVEVRSKRAFALAMRWIIGYSRNRGENSMRERLAAELMEAADNRGNSVKKREDTHKMADANKAYAHYRW